MAPLDFGSPYAAAIDLGGPANRPGEPRPPFEDAEMAMVVERLRLACAAIRRTSPHVLDFATTFNKVLVSQKDPVATRQFTSGSTGQFVGRSFVTNPHLDSVRQVDLAEALVHEGIHSLLYMQERTRSWGPAPELEDSIARVVSPWSGNHLSLASFLHACFVWYGLAHFGAGPARRGIRLAPDHAAALAGDARVPPGSADRPR